MNKLAYILIGIALALAGTVYAVNVTVPQSPAAGSVLFGNANGTYNSSTTPLSVDKVNNFIGINSSTPAAALGVVGSIYQNGHYVHLGSLPSSFQCQGDACMDFVGNDNTDSGIGLATENKSNGTAAFSYLTMNNNTMNASATAGIGGISYNSSNYNNTDFGTAFGYPNLLSLFTTDGPISIIAGSTTGPSYVTINTGGTASSTNERLRVLSGGNVDIGTSTPTTAQLFIQGSGTNNPLTIASSTGTQLLNVDGNGIVTLIGSGSQAAYANGTLQIPNDTSGQLHPGIHSTGNGTSLDTFGNGGTGNTGSTYQKNALIDFMVLGDNGTPSSPTANNFNGMSSGQVGLKVAAGSIGFSNGITANPDVAIARNAAGVLEVNNGTTGTATGTLVAGKIGLGTTNPESPLVVVNPSGDGFRMRTNNTSNYQVLDMGNTASLTYVESSKAGTNSYVPLTFWTSGAEKMRLDTSGNVGIGTTSPTAPLFVSGSNSGILQVNYPNTANTKSYLRLIPNGSPTVSNGTAGFQLFNTDFQANSTNYDYGEFSFVNNVLQLKSGNGGSGTVRPIDIYTGNNTGQLYWDTAGNVGINTTTPAAKLSIDDNAGGTLGLSVLQSDNTNPGAIISNNAGSGTILKLTGSGSNANIFLDNGNVGFGTTTPTQPLTVSGNIMAYGINANLISQQIGGKFGSVVAGTQGATFNFDNTGYFAVYGATSLTDDGSSPRDFYKVFGSNGDTMIGNNAFNTTDVGYKLNINQSGSLGYLSISTSTTSVLAVNSSGNVGIGTSSPVQKLSVVGNIYQKGNYTHLGNAPAKTPCGGDACVDLAGSDNTVSGVGFAAENNLASTSAYSYLAVNNDLQNGTGVSGIGGFQLNSSAYNDATFGTAFNTINQLSVFNTDGPLMFNTSTTTAAASYIDFVTGGVASSTNEAMRITSTGKVGIGTNNPSQTLDVQGNINIKNNNGIIYDAGTNPDLSNLSGLTTLRNVNGGTGIRFTSNDAATEWMRITNGGNVGIGTTTPSRALAVVGSISSSNLTSGNCVQAGSGGVLTTTGSACGSGGGGTPAGSDTQIQLNNAGVFGASSNFSYNTTTGQLQLQNTTGNGVPINIVNTANTSSLASIAITFTADNTMGSKQAEILPITGTYTGSDPNWNLTGPYVSINASSTGGLGTHVLGSVSRTQQLGTGTVTLLGSFYSTTLSSNSGNVDKMVGYDNAIQTVTSPAKVNNAIGFFNESIGGTGALGNYYGYLDSTNYNSASIATSSTVGMAIGGFPAANTVAALDVVTGQSIFNGGEISQSWSPSAAGNQDMINQFSIQFTASGGTQYGMDSTILGNISAGQTISGLTGDKHTVYNGGGGTLTNGIDFEAGTGGNSMFGTTTNFYGFKLDDVGSSGYVLTSAYGVYLGNQHGSGTNTNVPFGIYQSDTASYNYFGGNTGIGTTTPGSTVTLDGTNATLKLKYCMILNDSVSSSTIEYVYSVSGALTESSTKPAFCK